MIAPTFATPHLTVYTGHVLNVLRDLPGESVDCVVTSPPYWGLRAYGTIPQVWGGDPAHAHEWGESIIRIKGGISGGSSALTNPPDSEVRAARAEAQTLRMGAFCSCGAWRGEYGLEPTPELYVEHTVAIFREVRRVLRSHGTLWLNLGDSYCNTDKWGGGGGNTGKQTVAADGTVPSWAVRRRREPYGLKPKDLVGIPWRVAFALQADGWYLRSDIVWSKPNPMPESVTDRPTKAHEYVFLLSKSPRYYFDAEAVSEVAMYGGEELGIVRGLKSRAEAMGLTPSGNEAIQVRRRESKKRGEFAGKTNALVGREAFRAIRDTRNVRSVWEIATQPYPDAHFATFPRELPERCIKAGCPADGTVLDPFAGSGTTLAVARDLGRRAIGIELQPDYVALIERRCSQLALEITG